jgi:hypothetical protein
MIEDSSASYFAAATASAIEIAAVVEGSAAREISAVVIKSVMIVPIESPMAPSPAEAAKPADSETESE